jgi:hypothetical protein
LRNTAHHAMRLVELKLTRRHVSAALLSEVFRLDGAYSQSQCNIHVTTHNCRKCLQKKGVRKHIKSDIILCDPFSRSLHNLWSTLTVFPVLAMLGTIKTASLGYHVMQPMSWAGTTGLNIQVDLLDIYICLISSAASKLACATLTTVQYTAACT